MLNRFCQFKTSGTIQRGEMKLINVFSQIKFFKVEWWAWWECSGVTIIQDQYLNRKRWTKTLAVSRSLFIVETRKLRVMCFKEFRMKWNSGEFVTALERGGLETWETGHRGHWSVVNNTGCFQLIVRFLPLLAFTVTDWVLVTVFSVNLYIFCWKSSSNHPRSCLEL